MEEPGQPHINQKDFPNLLKSILERITDAFVALDKNWCYTYMNKKAGEIFNRQPEQMIGKHIWTEFPEGIGQPFYKAYHKAMAEQQYIYLEEYYTPYDKWFENHIYPSPEGLSIYFRDITHTKKQFLNIQESEERFRQLFENSMDAILLTAPDGSIYSANPAATRMFGRPEEEIKQIGRNGLVDVSDPRLKPALEERAKKGSFLGELNFFRKNGTKFTAEVSTSLFLDNEQRQRTTMIIRDITERKRIEQLLDTEKIVLEMISSGASLDLILEKIVLNIEVLTPGTIASILLLDIDGLHIHYGVSPHLPVDYNKALEGVEIGPQAGSCGTAAYRCELVIVTDIESDPLWINYRELARTYGLRACWSLPILNSEGKVLGTFAMYFMKPQSPKEEDIKLLNRASHIAQIAIERKLAEDSKRESEELFSKIFKASPIALSIAKISDGKLTEVNEVWCRLMEFSREEAIGYTLEDLNIIDSEIRAKLREEFLREGALRFVESVITTKSGNKKNILTSAELITSKGNNFAIILTLDITERMKSERLILEASNRLRFLIEGTATGLWDWDLNTNQVKYSHEWKQMLGYEDCEIVDNLDEWKRLTHTDDVDNVLKIVGKFLKKRTGTLETEFRMQHKSGEYRWILSRAAILFDEEMKSDHLVGLHIDITERKNTEAALLESELRHSLLFDNTMEAIAYHKVLLEDGKAADYEYIQVNNAFTALTGLKNVVGKRVSELVPGLHETNPELIERFGRVAITGKPEQYETYIASSKTWYFTSLYYLGKDIVVSVFDNITDRKISEIKIKESEERLNEAQRNAHIGSWRYNPGKPLIWSDQLYELFRFPLDLKLTYDEINLAIHPEDRDGSYNNAFMRVFEATENEYKTEYRIIWPDGQIRTVVSISKVHRDKNGIMIEVVGTVQDITERKKAEVEIIRAKKELELLNKRLNEVREEERTILSRELHDELGQNLTALKIDLKNAQNKYAGDMESFKKFGIMLSIVDETIKKVQEISSDLRPGILDDLGLVPAIEWYTDEFENRTKIKCTCTLEDNEINNPLFNTALYRIVQEALTNIIRHAKASNVNIKLLYDKDKVLLTIKDDGIGIPEEKIYQTSSLGLIGIRERIRHFNGSFSIVTRKNKGTELKVIIPLKKQLTQ